MKRSIQTILFLASLAAVGCGSNASDPGTQPNNNAGTNSVAGNGNGTGGASPGAGAPGTGGTPAAGGGTSPGAGAGGMVATGGAGPGDPPVLPNGITGPIMGDLTATNSVWGPGDITLTGAVNVPANTTLTINRGTHVIGAFPITATGGGVFKCNGVVTDPVSLNAGSVVLNGGAHTMQFCVVNSGLMTAIDVNGAQLTASHIQIQNYLANGIHVHGANASAKLNFVTIGSKTTLFTGDMAGKEAVGVVIDADAAMGGSSITNSVLGFLPNATNIGLKILGPSNTHLAFDNITSSGTLTTSDTPMSILTGDPRIADIPNLDHNLAFFSPDLDQADPTADFSQEPAPNGGRANLGYYGGTSLARITTVRLLTPNGCTRIEPGPTTVTWQSSPTTGAKTLELSVDAGATWMPLAKVAAGMDTGSMQVTLPNTPTDQAKIRFSQDNDPTHITDQSERPFGIGKDKNAMACANLRAPCTTGCKPFKVICYTGYRGNNGPLGVPGPNEPTEAEVREDLKLLQPLTHGIRTYGSNPLLHDGGSVPKIADELDLDLHMGIWVDDVSLFPDAVIQEAANKKALNDSIAIVNMGNHKSIKTLIISNEYMLRVRQKFPGDQSKTIAAEARLVTYINYVRSQIVNKSLPIVIGESYPDWLNASKALYDAVDIVMWHVHPWWQQVAIGNAAVSAQAAHEAVLARMKALGITKPERLAETGFPWGETQGAAVGSEDNQAQYLHDLNQYSLKVNLEYWFFEGFDEAWKSKEGPVGGKWGMFTAIRTAPPHKIIANVNTLIPTAEGWKR